MNYHEFLLTKRQRPTTPGLSVSQDSLNLLLYPFQKRVVEWALQKGRAALFEDCGLGKTPQQLEWAKHVAIETGKPVLIFAPLAVAEQTEREGRKFGVEVNVCRDQSQVAEGVNICNYEMLHHFTPDVFGGLVLDESSILKNYGGHYRKELTVFAKEIRFRLAATATPAPNDLIEIVNHSEFLGLMSYKECVGTFFILDNGANVHKFRLKHHTEQDFYSWLSEWSVAIRKPSDIGFLDDGFILPELRVTQHVVDGHISDGFLFPIEAQTLPERRSARKESLTHRVGICADLVNESDKPWLVWCNLNAESEALRRSIPGSVEVKGADSNEHKIDALNGFSTGKYRVLITKPSIAGFGMNWQHCSDMAFVGLSDSWEQYYQAVRRCWRFGQKNSVTAHVIVSESEGAVVANIERKERQATEMMGMLVEKMREQHYALA